MIALQLSDDNLRKVQRRKDIIDGLYNLSNDIKKTLALEPQIKEFAKSLIPETNLILLSRGFQSATCMEGALKIKEVSYIHAEGIFAGELKHGPLALIDNKMPIILVMNKDKHYVVLRYNQLNKRTPSQHSSKSLQEVVIPS
jgi:glucosamine--fructose-6-phosphate aminotransferase (isomerizing)